MPERSVTEKTTSSDLLKHSFKSASITELGLLIDDVVTTIREKNPTASPLQLYRKIADSFPQRIPEEKQNQALKAVASRNAKVSEVGRRVLLFLTLKTVFNALDEYFTKDEVKDSEMFQDVLLEAVEMFGALNPRIRLRQQLHTRTREAAVQHIVAREGMPVSWVEQGHHKIILERFAQDPDLVWKITQDRQEFRRLANELSKATGIKKRSIQKYLYLKIQLSFADTDELREKDIWSKYLEWKESTDRRFLHDLLTGKEPSELNERDRDILLARFGFPPYGKELTLHEIGDKYGLTRNRIQQIQARALRKLSRWHIMRGLREEESGEYRFPARKELYKRPLTFEDLERSRLAQLSLPYQTVYNLLEAGVTHIGQLRAMSGRQLSEKLGIAQADLVRGRLNSYDLQQRQEEQMEGKPIRPASLTIFIEPPTTLINKLTLSPELIEKLTAAGITEIIQVRGMAFEQLLELGATSLDLTKLRKALIALQPKQ